MWIWAQCQELRIQEKGAREVGRGTNGGRSWGKRRNKTKTRPVSVEEKKMCCESQINEKEGQGEATEESGMQEWKRESDSEEGGIAYLGGTLDSSHLFQHQAQPLPLFVNVARLAFAPRGLSGNKHNVTRAQHLLSFPLLT